jgi:hypothetical protein
VGAVAGSEAVAVGRKRRVDAPLQYRDPSATPG